MSEKSVDLPEELITEILLRLTVKTLLQCKCVCKLWRSLISNPNFATSHFQLADSPTIKLFCLGNNSETLSIDFNASLNNESSYDSRSNDFLPPRSCPEIGGSCRGFIFLHTYTDFFYIWNPSTCVQMKIPASPVTNLPYSYLDTYLYGFTYDHSTDDYLIVLGSCDSRAFDYRVPYFIYFEIFSLRANKWKHIEVDTHLIICFGWDSNVGLLLNDSIHWMVRNLEMSTYDFIDVIIAFDLKESRMLEIALPCGFDYKDDPSNHNLLVLGGLISASIVEMHTIKIWVMKIYAVHSSWTKILEFSVDPALHRSLSIVCFTNCGDILGREEEGGLMKFNGKGQLLEHHSGPKNIDPKRFQIAVYTESLLSLPCGIEQV